MMAFNERLFEINHKILLNNYCDSLLKVYEHGQFYFKYFNHYMAPQCSSLVELKLFEDQC